MSEAQYYALLTRAYHGAATRQEMMWQISLVEGWSMILASGLMHGEAYIWPDARLSEAGRKLMTASQLKSRWQSGQWKPQIEL